MTQAASLRVFQQPASQAPRPLQRRRRHAARGYQEFFKRFDHARINSRSTRGSLSPERAKISPGRPLKGRWHHQARSSGCGRAIPDLPERSSQPPTAVVFIDHGYRPPRLSLRTFASMALENTPCPLVATMDTSSAKRNFTLQSNHLPTSLLPRQRCCTIVHDFLFP